MQGLRIGEVADRTGVTVDTIRYYERIGVIPEVSRTASGYRQFDDEVVERLRFVRRAQELGFTLEEIKELLELRVSEEATCEDVWRQATAKRDEIAAKIDDLERMHEALEEIIEQCPGGGPTEECPILDGLDRGFGSDGSPS